MKTYWDSSALVEALHAPALRNKISRATAVTRPHALAEVFSTLTKGVNFKYPATDAAKMLADLKADMSFVELSAAETQAAIEQASERGVRGARIHDLLHATAAVKSGATVLLTLDEAGFADLDLDVEVRMP